MKIYLADDNYNEITWVIKSKDVSSFLQEYDHIYRDELDCVDVNNLHQICIAVMQGAGRYSGDIYEASPYAK